MLEDANKAYFKSQGWPMMLSGEPKSIVQLDKGELTALALKYAIVLQTEFAQIKVPPKPKSEDDVLRTQLAAHAEAADVGVQREQTKYAARGSRADHAKRGHGPRVIRTIVGPKDISKPDHAKRGHGPRGKRKKSK